MKCNRKVNIVENVTLYRIGNTLLVEPTTPSIVNCLRSELSFNERKVYLGYEAVKRQRMGLSKIENIPHTLFSFDQKGRLFTFFGFWKVVRNKLKNYGYNVSLKDNNPDKPEIYTPNWDILSNFELRPNQPEFLQALAKNRCGRFNCPPGFGKSYMIAMIALMYPKARIDVVSKNVAVLRDRIYPELLSLVSDVGIVGGTKKIQGKRVMCYTVGSMHYSDHQADILIGDECHQLAADQAFNMLPRWTNSRNYGLSASNDKRFDNKDARVHGIFGPIIFDVSYKEAQSHNMVVPLIVNWREVNHGPKSDSYMMETDKKRFCIWQNTARNKMIAEDARSYTDDTQVLVIVDTIEHAMNLKRELPEFTLVYMENGIDSQKMAKFVAEGCCSANEPKMDFNRRQQLTKDFEKGNLKKVIATGVWNVGVSFNHLAVLIRADGGGSAINDIQIPGRVSRIAEGKSHGIIHDYVDNFCPNLYRKSRNRSKSYKENSWKQNFPSAYSKGT